MKHLSNLSKVFIGALLLLFPVLIIPGQANALTWGKIVLSDPKPDARNMHSSVYDSVTNRMIVYGGQQNVVGYPLNDVWVLENANGSGGNPNWIELFPDGSPSQRWGHSAVYDSASNRMIIYGGDSNVGWCEGLLSDVWVLVNANGTEGNPQWIQLFPTGTPPPALRSHSAVYDPDNNRMVLYGGMTTSCGGDKTDVWILENANGLGVTTPNWIHLFPTGTPPSACEHTTVYDKANNRMIVLEHLNPDPYYGLSVLENANGIGTAHWSQPAQTGTPPSYIRCYSSVYDSVNNRIIVSGGSIVVGENINVWAIENANGLGGSPTWNVLEPLFDPVNGFPAGRDQHTTVFDEASGKMTIFGGRANYAGNPNTCITNDAWVLSLSDGVPENQPPTAEAGPEQVVFDDVTLDGSGSSDPDGAIVSYFWELQHREDSAFDTTAEGENPTVLELEPGFYDVTLTVTDDDGLSGTDTMLLAAAGYGQASCDELQELIIQKDQAIADLSLQIIQKDQTIAGLNTQASDLTAQVSDLTAQVSDLNAQVTDLNAQVTDLNAQIAQKNQEIADLNAVIAAAEQDIANLTQSLQSAFTDLQFSIPGDSTEEQIDTLVDAIENLNYGQRQALYENLGGKIGNGKKK